MYEKDKKDLEEYATINGSTAEKGIEQADGSIVVLRSVQGAPCEEFILSAEEREEKGWAPILPDESQN